MTENPHAVLTGELIAAIERYETATGREVKNISLVHAIEMDFGSDKQRKVRFASVSLGEEGSAVKVDREER